MNKRSATKTAASRSQKRKPIQSKKPALPRRCLIVECDYDKLNAQGLGFSNELRQIVQVMAHDIKVVLIRSKALAASQFSEVYQKGKSFDIIVLIGHGNPRGIQFANDEFVEYDVLAKWITPFKPKTLFLVTCKGGQSFPTEKLFLGVKTLKNIFGSPINSSKAGLEVVRIILPLLFLQGMPHKNVLRAIQIGNFFLTEGILLHHSRTDFLKRVPMHNLLDDLYPLASPLKRFVSELISKSKVG